MKIGHLAIWVSNLEEMRSFYTTYFGAVSGEKYTNLIKGFSSYFLAFGDNGLQLELMKMPGISTNTNKRGYAQGLAHFALSTGSREQVDQLTEKLREAGFAVAGEPRVTGDGYYESVILDPEGNCIEITE